MSLVIVALVVLFFIGSVMMLRPSARDRHSSVLRQYALQKGMRVKVATSLGLPLEASRPTLACVLRERDKEDRQWAPQGAVRQDPDSGKLRFQGDFHRYEDRLRDLFAQLPAGCEQLYSKRSHVGICWDERGENEALDRIDQGLDELLKLRLPGQV